MRFSAVPLGHKFIAVLIAAAVGGGVYTWFRHDAVQRASSAELSFDMHAARRIDSGLVQAHEPAVVFAQSVLTDQRIAELSKSAYLSTSGMMSRVGEFRSRLELTQPTDATGQELQVFFRDPDPAKGVATANAVADALTKWVPSPDGPGAITEPTATTPQPAAQQTPAKTAAPAPAAAAKATPAPAPAVKKSAPLAENGASGSLAAGLGALQEQLSSTSQKLEGAGFEGSKGRAYAQSEKQQLLKSQVHAAEAKLVELRGQATGNDRARLGQIQEALASILGRGGAGVSASQLRREIEGLTRAISVVDEQRAAVEKEGAVADSSSAAPTPARSTPDTSSAAAAAAASSSGSKAITESNVGSSNPTNAGSQGNAPTSAAPQPQPTPDSSDFGSDAAMLNPLHVVRLAGAAATPLWWPAAAAAFLCGFLYWLLAAAMQRPVEYEESGVEATHYARFITPDVPVPSAATPVAETAAEPIAGSLFGSGGYRRASFTYEPAPNEPGARAGSGAVDVASAPVSIVEEKPTAQENAAAGVVEETQRTPFREKVVEIDPWADLMQKALSETEIGRKFESPADRGDASTKKDEDARRPGRGDRWAS